MRKQLQITMLILAVSVGIATSAHATTLRVANDGVDGSSCMGTTGLGCGGKKSPCRSITCGITNAAAGDTIVVGPGVYGGNLDGDGTVGPGEESPTAGCGCAFGIDKPVTLLSSDGAAATVIDARNVNVKTNVFLGTSGARLGKPGKGFMVTGTRAANNNGIVVAAPNVTVAGNQVIALGDAGASFAVGIDVRDGPGPVVIEGNQVIGWAGGINAQARNSTIRTNHASQNCGYGIQAFATVSVVKNVALDNGTSANPDGTGCAANAGSGIKLRGASSAVANACYGNETGLDVDAGFAGTIAMNNLVANSRRLIAPGSTVNCGLQNSAVVGLSVIDNYWGATTGPGDDPADLVCNVNGGTTTAAPFATKAFKVKAPFKP